MAAAVETSSPARPIAIEERKALVEPYYYDHGLSGRPFNGRIQFYRSESGDPQTTYAVVEKFQNKGWKKISEVASQFIGVQRDQVASLGSPKRANGSIEQRIRPIQRFSTLEIEKQDAILDQLYCSWAISTRSKTGVKEKVEWVIIHPLIKLMYPTQITETLV